MAATLKRCLPSPTLASNGLEHGLVLRSRVQENVEDSEDLKANLTSARLVQVSTLGFGAFVIVVVGAVLSGHGT